LRGIQQSADRLQLNIAGDFQPGSPAFVYFDLWPVPVRPDALTVLPDQIVIDLTKDPDARRWASDLYPLTVYQPGRVRDCTGSIPFAARSQVRR